MDEKCGYHNYLMGRYTIYNTSYKLTIVIASIDGGFPRILKPN